MSFNIDIDSKGSIDYKEMVQWITLNDLDQDKHETMAAAQAIEDGDFRLASKIYRSIFSDYRSRNNSELFTPYEMILLELILHSEVSEVS